MLRRISFVFLLLFSLAAQAAGTAGLTYETYQGTGASPSINPLTYPTVRSTGISPNINYPVGSYGTTILGSGLADRVIVHWAGYINLSTSGTYQFKAISDDGIMVTIGDTKVINSWVDGGTVYDRTGTPTYYNAGVYYIDIWYYENGGGQGTVLQWLVNGSYQVVPTTVFATDSTYWTPSAPQYSSSITGAQQTSKTTNTTLRQSQQGNLVDIEQIGDNNTITIRQGSSPSGKNRMEVYANGDGNTLNLNQGYLTDGLVSPNDTNNHYLNLNLMGNTNNVTTRQTGTAQYMETTISGNSNVINLHQQGTGSKTMFTNVVGNSNTITATQQDSGQHYLDVKLTGNGHSVTATQQGTGNHAATIDLTNSGGSSNLNLNQLGSTAQTYSITESCVNPAGCNTTITQGQ